MLADLLIAAVLSVTPPHGAAAQSNIEVPPSGVRQLICGEWAGTAWVVAPGIIATAGHVANKASCVDSVTNRPATEYNRDDAHDFSLMSMDTTDMTPLPYTCERFQSGHEYITYGFTNNGFNANPIRATAEYSPDPFPVEDDNRPGMRYLEGLMLPGMSGGPIRDRETGVTYGINNVSNSSFFLGVFPFNGGEVWSYELADTPLCQRAQNSVNRS